MCYLPLAVLGVFRGPVTYVFASRSPVSPRGLAGALRLLQLLPDTSNDGWVSFFKVDIPLELHTCISSCLVDVLQVLRFIILEVRVSILRQEPKTVLEDPGRKAVVSGQRTWKTILNTDLKETGRGGNTTLTFAWCLVGAPLNQRIKGQ